MGNLGPCPGNIVDAEEGVGEEQRLDGAQFEGGAHVARTVEGARRVVAQHRLECLQRAHLLRRLGVLPMACTFNHLYLPFLANSHHVSFHDA